MTKRYFEFIEGNSRKFWEILQVGSTVITNYGRIGAAAQVTEKDGKNDAGALKIYERLIHEKIAKGYIEKKSGGKRPAPTALAKSKPVNSKTAALNAAPKHNQATGAPKAVAALQKLALAAREKNESMTRTYVLVASKVSAKEPRTVMRAGGGPIGVTPTSRPRRTDDRNEYRQHLLTIDLDAIPELRAQHKKLAKSRAVAVFIDDAEDNEAFDEDTQETAVVILSDKDIARGEWQGPAVGDPKARKLDAWPVDVPTRIFKYDPWGDDEGPNLKSPLHQLYEGLMSKSRVGGGLIDWTGDIENHKGWLCQFSEDLVDVNLGDAGTMFVFLDRAFWCGH